jgi:hypothetical protein
MKPTLFIAGALAMGLAGMAAAQTGNVFELPPKERYQATDKNRDGKVTKEEFLAVLLPDSRPYIDAIWDNRDADKNGWLTEPEMNANSGGRAGRGGAAAPAAGRGVTAAPAPAAAAK